LARIAYVKEHFGSFEDPKPGYEKFGGYFNIDSGTGRVRGAAVFGPPEAATSCETFSSRSKPME
jgi:carboxypeptidase Q